MVFAIRCQEQLGQRVILDKLYWASSLWMRTVRKFICRILILQLMNNHFLVTLHTDLFITCQRNVTSLKSRKFVCRILILQLMNNHSLVRLDADLFITCQRNVTSLKSSSERWLMQRLNIATCTMAHMCFQVSGER